MNGSMADDLRAQLAGDWPAPRRGNAPVPPPCPRCGGPRVYVKLERGSVFACVTPGCFGELEWASYRGSDA